MGALGKKKEKKMCRLVLLLFPSWRSEPSSIERGLEGVTTMAAGEAVHTFAHSRQLPKPS